ncbi:enoyl-CoA hydratase/isomerase family protein [Rhodobacteraceae bacterium RKSG542]|uniref:enoyl-CoA hydratase/isomerase family protein n=1 Tax=Pseudovibrio flavus TaxID=2529854 RepID=UPI0012BC5FF7|nr:enoyl-CoA hydratase/isomerase family protein [Pseudovibrio flavus]MTI17386.1 enoyl-CoA hydratase/isomerase family protein [Pseudovibrio flavus]
MTKSEEVLFKVSGKAGIATLNRPKALNALSHGMVSALYEQLKAWESDPAVKHVIINSASERAFCAGGDIRQVHDMGAERSEESITFFADEYRLNAYMKAYPKPLIALIDGIVMGGGVGISVHGKYRVGTEKTMFAMPETGIGFFPDVGGSYFLPRMPHRIGYYCALTADRLRQADCLWTGVLTHAVKSEDMSVLEAALCESEDVDGVLAKFAIDAGDAPVKKIASVVEKCFGADTVEEVVARLGEEQGSEHAEFAAKTLKTLASRSPTSMKLTYEQLTRGASLPMNECMVMEYRMVARTLKGVDFYEGVRAVLVDKDHSPKWSPATLEAVSDADIAAYFDKPVSGDLSLQG